MRKWVSLDENNNIIGVFESDIEQQHASEILYDVDVTSLLNKIFVDSYTVNENPELVALEWRNQELLATDWINDAPDHPNYQDYITYRQQLRDWTATENFPETRPTLNV